MLSQNALVKKMVLFTLIGALYVLSAFKVETSRNELDPTQVVSVLQVKPEVLEIVSGEFSEVLADYLLLKASVYLGGRNPTLDINKKVVSTLFQQATALDPYFFQTCFFAQAYLPWWRRHYVDDAIGLISIFREHRDWDWQPGFYLGFDYFYFLKDNLNASRYLLDAADMPGAGTLIGFLGARLAQRGGQAETSIVFLKAMYESTNNENAKDEIKRRIEALEGILVLEKAIEQFKSMFFNHPPDTLERLVEVGILKELPTNPARKDGLYWYQDGKLDF